MAKLIRTSDGKLGHTPEDVEAWAAMYENVSHKLQNGIPLEWYELDNVVILLKETVNKMRDKPESFLPRKKQGRPNQNTKNSYIKKLQIYAYLEMATNIAEARRMLAEELLKHENLDYSEKTYEEYLSNKIEAIEVQTRNFDFESFAKKRSE